MAATPTSGGRAIMLFTLTGNGGPTGADHGGFYPSTAFGRLTSTSGGLLNSTINIADLGRSPQDGFSEYQGYPGPTRPRWGDYSWGLFVPGTGGRIYFANEYIQYPNCTGSSFTLTRRHLRRDPGRWPTGGHRSTTSPHKTIRSEITDGARRKTPRRAPGRSALADSPRPTMRDDHRAGDPMLGPTSSTSGGPASATTVGAWASSRPRERPGGDRMEARNVARLDLRARASRPAQRRLPVFKHGTSPRPGGPVVRLYGSIASLGSSGHCGLSPRGVEAAVRSPGARLLSVHATSHTMARDQIEPGAGSPKLGRRPSSEGSRGPSWALHRRERGRTSVDARTAPDTRCWARLLPSHRCRSGRTREGFATRGAIGLRRATSGWSFRPLRPRSPVRFVALTRSDER